MSVFNKLVLTSLIDSGKFILRRGMLCRSRFIFLLLSAALSMENAACADILGPASGQSRSALMPAGEASSETVEKSGADNFSLESGLSPNTREIVEKLGSLAVYRDLVQAQKEAAASHAEAGSLEEMARNQRVVYYHVRLNQEFQTASIEVQSFRGRLDYEASKLSDLKAVITNGRERLQHKTSFVNLISGGLTKLGGYTTAMAGGGDSQVNILEVFDGAVQSGLSSMLIRRENIEAVSTAATPPSLVAFLQGGTQTPADYPRLVWAFINSSPPGRTDGKSRRQLLLDSWVKTGRVLPIAGSSAASYRLSRSAMIGPDVRFAMTEDIKSMLSGLQESLLEFSRLLRDSYGKDPSI